ncbi:hypothetical protein AB4Z19_08960 [Pseudoduganella sp. RAF19]|uniref:hypothetical protein n=1 Tax=Pseudoduganella sp. RAF19 TaxID=3233052 RepID=UPI003F9D7C60
MDRFVWRSNPNSLSVRDLLEARDHYHLHFANLPTVIGTAIGRYRIRRDDKNFASEDAERGGADLGERTLANSDFRDWSLPCVLVFVKEWLSREFTAQHPELAVPPLLYLPDGRKVFTCPILVEKREHDLPSADTAVYGANKFGPNFQVYVSDQGTSRMGVASAIVEDGACAYALISRHLSSGADVGTPVTALPRAQRALIGRVTARAVDGLPLQDIYPGFAGQGAQLTLDAALVKLDNVPACTPQYLGIGTMGQPIDLSAETLSLDLIGCPVFTELPGGVRVEGSVHAMFYRHTTIGGADSLAELVIGPRNAQSMVETRPGDSGAVWFWDEVADQHSNRGSGEAKGPTDSGGAPAVSENRNQHPQRPLCVQWGGHGFNSGQASPALEFALGTSLSAICKALRVEVVEDWESGQSRYWGKVGHYNIGYAACLALQSEKAQAFFEANAKAIGVTDADIVAGKLPSASHKDKFIALADVPDLVWRSTRGKDKANHFADMDEKGQGKFAGKTLMELWNSDKKSRSPEVWTAFYSSIDPNRKPEHRGALPFRVAQLFDVMVAAVRAKHLDEFLCAAGVLAHYLGDACQPLHVSYLHHGQPDDPGDDKVHSVYEDDMLDQAAEEVVAGVKDGVDKAKVHKMHLFDTGAEAADTSVKLMQRTVKTLPPAEVLDVYERVRGSGQAAAMWEELGSRTIKCMVDGAFTLATVWQSAWVAGGGDESGHFSLETCRKPVDTGSLKKLYDEKTFAESRWLHEMRPLD